MSDETDKSNPVDATGFDSDAIHGADDQTGLSLDELSEAYAGLIETGDDPYSEDSVSKESDAEVENAPSTPNVDEQIDTDDSFEVTPRAIAESMFFVGTPDNSPLTSKQLASLMRGVRPQEVDGLVEELNEAYEEENCPFRIISAGAGYQMTLRESFASLRNSFYGKVKDAKLSQASIDVLAIVAYNQPLTRVEVDELRGKPSGGLLNQLVRRQLLSITRPEKKPRTGQYQTTNRFLSLFDLENIADLPRSQDLDRTS